MSLFKARDWWSTTSGCEEFYDIGCLFVANVDNSPSGHDKIVVGSFQGLVRIYLPHPPAFSPDHVILERDMGTPVLQVAVGRFIQGSQTLHLALLHPRELTVHTLTSSQTEEGVQHVLTLVYRHTFQRTTANMTWGPFGGARGVDHLCVQSMDGQLSFFHQESAAFTCFLPNFLLPGPLRYLPRTDSLVTANSAHVLQTFRYQTLAVASGNVRGESSRETQPSGGKKIAADWSMNLGEHVIDIRVVTVAGCPSHILVLGERTVFCLRDNGKMRFMKKLEFSPSCIHAYGIVPPQRGEEGEGMVQYLLASHTYQLLVFQDSSLVWAARVDQPPADITVAQFQELSGVIVSLDELGHLVCCYLGTDPSVFSASSSASRELNYEELDREMKDLQHTIRQSQQEGILLHSPEANMVMHVVVEPQARIVDLGEEAEEEEEARRRLQKCVEIKLHTLSSSSAVLRDVTVNIVSTLPLTTHPSHLHLDEVTISTPSQPLVITVVCTPTLLPLSHTITISTTYTTPDGLSRVSEMEVELPLSLFCEPCDPSKAALHKVTVDINHPAVSLHALFPHFQPGRGEGGPQNAMGFQLLAGPEVTIVTSKSSDRYRIQSESFPAIAGFLEELLTRLSRYYANEEPQFQTSYTSPLPLNEYFEIIEHHFKLRMNIEHCRELLGRHAQQFRSIQKRLLSRFKDKTPVGLAHLDTLLDGTYMQLMALGEKNEVFQLEMHECSNQLSCATQLINTLLRLTVHMSDEDYTILQSSLSPVVNPDSEQGWEEQTDAAITHLLRTTLAKSTRDQSVILNSVELPADSQKLKRHIALLCDRISKGGSLGGRKEEGGSLRDGREATRSLNTRCEGGGRDRQRQSKPEVLSRLPVNHSVKKKAFLPALVEHREPTPPQQGSSHQQTEL